MFLARAWGKANPLIRMCTRYRCPRATPSTYARVRHNRLARLCAINKYTHTHTPTHALPVCIVQSASSAGISRANEQDGWTPTSATYFLRHNNCVFVFCFFQTSKNGRKTRLSRALAINPPAHGVTCKCSTGHRSIVQETDRPNAKY